MQRVCGTHFPSSLPTIACPIAACRLLPYTHAALPFPLLPFPSQNPATHAEAERTLQQFRSSPRPYEACQYILDHASDPTAKFYAVLTIRDAALREWTALPPPTRQDLLRFLFHLAIVRTSADAVPLVRRQAAAAVAVLLKRIWGEASQADRHALIGGVDVLAGQAGTAEARRASMEVLHAIVVEFSPLTSSPMGLPWDYHAHAKAELQEGYLMGFLQHALSMARQTARAAVAGTDGGVCEASVVLLSALLAWEHGDSGTMIAVSSAAGPDGERPTDANMHVRPPAAWRELLLGDEAFSWLLDLDAAIKAAPGGSSSSLGSAVRQVIIQLASMSGDIFIKEGDRRGLGLQGPPGLYTGPAHLRKVLAILVRYITPAAAAAARAAAWKDDAELDTCRALLGAAVAHRITGFVEAAHGLEGGPHAALTMLAQLTAAMLAAGDVGNAFEAADVLLEMWAELLIDPCKGAVAGGDEVAAAAAAVFEAAMQRELATAADQALEDEAEYEGGEEAHSEAWLAGLAAIGRAACAHVLPALARQLHHCQTQLQRCMGSGADPSAALEQLSWVVRMCGHVLADSGDGEMPLVPIAIAEACAAAAQRGAEDPAVGLAQCLLALGAVCLEHAGQPVISPRLLEEVCVCFGRWADTYLLADSVSDAGVSLAVDRAFGAAGGGRDVVDGLVRLATAALGRYPGEKVLHKAVSGQLLGALVHRESACSVVVQCPAWLELCGAVAGQAAEVAALEAGVHRHLMQTLCLAAGGLPSGPPATDYVHRLVGPMSGQLQALAAEDAATVQRPDRAARVLNLVQSLRGAARAARHSSHAALYFHLEAVQPAMLRLLHAFQTQRAVYAVILKLAAEVVEYYAAYLEASQALGLFQFAMQFVDTYAWQQSALAKPAVAGASEVEDEYRAIVALLRLLTQLTNAEAPSEAEVAGAVFAGLSRILPLITEAHLKFPKLRHACFSLLAHVVEAHAPRVAGLPGPTFQAMLGALRFGTAVQGDAETEAAVFEAIAALAKHHVLATRAGAPGLGPLNAPDAANRTALGGLLEALLRRVLVDDPGFGVVDFAAEAALPLCLAEPAVLEASAGALLEAAGCDEAARGSALTAFSELAKSAHAAGAMDRQSRREFSGVFRRFALEVRGAVRRR